MLRIPLHFMQNAVTIGCFLNHFKNPNISFSYSYDGGLMLTSTLSSFVNVL